MKKLALTASFTLAALCAARASDLIDSILCGAADAFGAQSAVTSTVPAAAEANGDAAIDATNDPAPSNTLVASPTRNAWARRAGSSFVRRDSSRQSARYSQKPSGSESKMSGNHIEPPVTFSLRGGAGSDGYVAAIEYRKTLGESPFDLSIRGFTAQVEDSGYNYYSGWSRVGWRWRSYRYSRKWELQQTDYGMEGLLIWTPCRREILEPFAGVGVRYESAKSKYSSYRSSYTQDDDSAACPVGRLGLKVNLDRLSLTGEYIFGGDVGDIDGTTELIGDIGFYLTQRMQIHLFAESLDMKVDRSTIFGGGLTLDF